MFADSRAEACYLDYLGKVRLNDEGALSEFPIQHLPTDASSSSFWMAAVSHGHRIIRADPERSIAIGTNGDTQKAYSKGGVIP